MDSMNRYWITVFVIFLLLAPMIIPSLLATGDEDMPEDPPPGTPGLPIPGGVKPPENGN